MSKTVEETIADYTYYLLHTKAIKETSYRAVELCLRYFTEIYGDMETTELKPSDFQMFNEQLKIRKKQRDKKGGKTNLSPAFIYKIMVNVKTYVKRLADHSLLSSLTPSDVPLQKVPDKIPQFLTKEEMTQILSYLETLVRIPAKNNRERCDRYMRNALVRMLYTT